MIIAEQINIIVAVKRFKKVKKEHLVTDTSKKNLPSK
jgi:hypothetical protein